MLGLTTNVPGVSNYTGDLDLTYDTKDRRTGDQSARGWSYNHSFAYDTSGNPTTFKGTSLSFNSDNQRTGTGFSYDGNGNPIGRGLTRGPYAGSPVARELPALGDLVDHGSVIWLPYNLPGHPPVVGPLP